MPPGAIEQGPADDPGEGPSTGPRGQGDGGRRKKGGWFGKHRGQGGSNQKFENIAEGLRTLLARCHVERTTDEGTWVAGVFVYGGSKTSLYNLRRGIALAIPQCRLTPLSRLPFGMAPGPGPQPGPLRESIVCYFIVFLQTHIFAEGLKDAIKDLVLPKPAPTCNIKATVCSFDDGVDLPPWFPPMVEGAAAEGDDGDDGDDGDEGGDGDEGEEGQE